MWIFVALAFVRFAGGSPQQTQGTLAIEARSGTQPISQAEIIVGDRVAITDERGQALLELPPGEVTITVQKVGFRSQTRQAAIREGATTRLVVELQTEINQEVTVTAGRTERRIEDTPLRVEVLQEEEIEEKALMTPGDNAMLLNE